MPWMKTKIGLESGITNERETEMPEETAGASFIRNPLPVPETLIFCLAV